MINENQVFALDKLGGGWPAHVRFSRFFPVAADEVRELWVNPFSGDDENEGTEDSPLRTVQTAVLMFKRPFHLPVWGIGEDRIVHVVGSAGTTMTESIIVPPHAGPGALRIVGQVTLVHEGLEVSATPFSTPTGFEVKKTLNVEGDPLTASTLGYTSVVVPQVSLATSIYDAVLDSLPVVDNGTGSLDVVALDPGVFSAFSYAAGALVDVIRPNITWRPQNSTEYAFTAAAAIVNMGGALVVSNFECKPATVGGSFGSFLESHGSASYPFNGSKTILDRCFFSGQFQEAVSGSGGCTLSGCNYVDSGEYRELSRAAGLTVNNLAADTGILVVNGPCNAALHGVLSEQTGAGNGGLRFANNANARLAADIRAPGAGETQLGVLISTMHVAALSIEDAGSLDAIVTENAHIDLKIAANAGRLVGSAGNNSHGMRLGEFSFGTSANEGSMALSGALGDLEVGALAARNWTDGSITDAEQLARYST